MLISPSKLGSVILLAQVELHVDQQESRNGTLCSPQTLQHVLNHDSICFISFISVSNMQTVNKICCFTTNFRFCLAMFSWEQVYSSHTSAEEWICQCKMIKLIMIDCLQSIWLLNLHAIWLLNLFIRQTKW